MASWEGLTDPRWEEYPYCTVPERDRDDMDDELRETLDQIANNQSVCINVFSMETPAMADLLCLALSGASHLEEIEFANIYHDGTLFPKIADCIPHLPNLHSLSFTSCDTDDVDEDEDTVGYLLDALERRGDKMKQLDFADVDEFKFPTHFPRVLNLHRQGCLDTICMDDDEQSELLEEASEAEYALIALALRRHAPYITDLEITAGCPSRAWKTFMTLDGIAGPVPYPILEVLDVRGASLMDDDDTQSDLFSDVICPAIQNMPSLTELDLGDNSQLEAKSLMACASMLESRVFKLRKLSLDDVAMGSGEDTEEGTFARKRLLTALGAGSDLTELHLDSPSGSYVRRVYKEEVHAITGSSSDPEDYWEEGDPDTRLLRGRDPGEAERLERFKDSMYHIRAFTVGLSSLQCLRLLRLELPVLSIWARTPFASVTLSYLMAAVQSLPLLEELHIESMYMSHGCYQKDPRFQSMPVLIPVPPGDLETEDERMVQDVVEYAEVRACESVGREMAKITIRHMRRQVQRRERERAVLELQQAVGDFWSGVEGESNSEDEEGQRAGAEDREGEGDGEGEVGPEGEVDREGEVDSEAGSEEEREESRESDSEREEEAEREREEESLTTRHQLASGLGEGAEESERGGLPAGRTITFAEFLHEHIHDPWLHDVLGGIQHTDTDTEPDEKLPGTGPDLKELLVEAGIDRQTFYSDFTAPPLVLPPSLKRLTLDRISMSPTVFGQVLAAVARPESRVECLSMSYGSFNESHCPLFSRLRGANKLSSLSMYENQLGKGARHIFPVLETLPSLTNLNLSECRIPADVLTEGQELRRQISRQRADQEGEEHSDSFFEDSDNLLSWEFGYSYSDDSDSGYSSDSDSDSDMDTSSDTDDTELDRGDDMSEGELLALTQVAEMIEREGREMGE
ncbi:hypothetical protein KIPB_000774 [Kipferlia bialata]|uniref:Uncharacterized protein n=1 Tax=Kipferlia bialata TaxID=797122 RepID=A0A9K3CR20_9EUKA|nr:hypothetical protein KIPB_000774 [Kipferlia bialata]|eukprot:g774.t1